ncbi:MAG TPA: ParA family protein [Caulobacteraceae bacterium]|nr:ParA family protein [Caulobacteraceae bacterium]
MPTIAFVSSKGGVGKSTSAVLLAMGLVKRGLAVTLADSDPNLPLTAWSRFGWRPDAITVLQAPHFHDLPGVLRKAKAGAPKASEPWVIVDTEGGAPAMAGAAVARADLVITPLSSSWLEAREALKIAGVVAEACRRERRPIPVVGLFSRLPSSHRRSVEDAKTLLTANNLPVLEAVLTDREIFRSLFARKEAVTKLTEGKSRAYQAARDQIDALSAEVMAFF